MQSHVCPLSRCRTNDVVSHMRRPPQACISLSLLCQLPALLVEAAQVCFKVTSSSFTSCQQPAKTERTWILSEPLIPTLWRPWGGGLRSPPDPGRSSCSPSRDLRAVGPTLQAAARERLGAGLAVWHMCKVYDEPKSLQYMKRRD